MAGIAKSKGDVSEARALEHLTRHGLALVRRNYRIAQGPYSRGGEVDLVMREPDGTLVFVEVRARANDSHGGAAASIGAAKQRAVRFAARRFLAELRGAPPPCRFDVVAIDGDRIEWLKAAFDSVA
jgi:putative endonuclease